MAFRAMAALMLTAMQAGCTVGFRANHDSLSGQAIRASNGRYEAVDGVRVVRVPGATVTLSASEVLGKDSYGPATFRRATTFDVSSAKNRALRFRLFSDVDGCALAQSTYDVLANAVRASFARLDQRRVPYGTVDLYLIRRGAHFSKTTLSFHFGRRIGVAFYHDCDGVSPANAVADTLDIIAVSFHELSHVIDRLYVRRQHHDDDPQFERVADYSVGCLYNALEGTDAGRELAQTYPLTTYYGRGAVETGAETTKRADDSCREWVVWANPPAR
jgi:hypothetical protein